jgi:hypothetical protein
MRFDASPSVQELVRKTVAIDPRMVRCGVVRMGGRLKDIVDVKGTVDWQRRNVDRFQDVPVAVAGRPNT